MNKLRHTTYNIVNKGFSGMRRFVTRFNFLCTLKGNLPQSLTGHIVKRSFSRHGATILHLFAS